VGKLTTLHYFGETPDGQHPVGELLEGRDGNLYGVTREGGLGFGTIFKINTRGDLTILHRFDDDKGEGRYPECNLVQAKDSDSIYGTASEGRTGTKGSGGFGTIFRITSSGEFTTLHSFPENEEDGKYPGRGLIEESDGAFYGVTKAGGKWPGYGTIFKITAAGVFNILYKFDLGRNEPIGPFGPMIRGNGGNFCGSTATNDSVFCFTPPAGLTTLYKFRHQSVGRYTPPGRIKERQEWAASEKAAGRDHPEVTDGSVVRTRLLQAADGALWGTTEQGGIWDLGTVFKVDPTEFPKP
jgi:uncharacterized repeat protein (TIGR03803 family)